MEEKDVWFRFVLIVFFSFSSYFDFCIWVGTTLLSLLIYLLLLIKKIVKGYWSLV